MAFEAKDAGWSLEVVRGRKPGQIFPLVGREIILGNAPTPTSEGIDLAGQEGATSRRMAGHHAMLTLSGQGPTLRDLDSPGGTFVNRRRVLPGQACPLRAGDEIQLGAVVLRVATPPRVEADAPVETFSYALEGGPTCRTWDDFLVASAQRWEDLRDDLASGRIASFLTGVGRDDLLPRSAVASSADDRLDAWLASLPTTRPSRPELDVHPKRIVVKAAPGGGMVRKTARISNVGHRLLRCSARVEPPELIWLKLDPQFDDVSFATVEETDLAFDVIIPMNLPIPLAGEIVVEGNGGSKRITVVLEPRPVAAVLEEAETAEVGPSPLAAWLARGTSRSVILSASVGFAIFRLIVAIVGREHGNSGELTSVPSGPGLGGVALALAVAGIAIGAGLATRRGGVRDTFPGAFAGGCVGALIAAMVVAACRSVEPAILGEWSTATLAACGLWAATGAVLAALARFSGRTHT